MLPMVDLGAVRAETGVSLERNRVVGLGAVPPRDLEVLDRDDLRPVAVLRLGQPVRGVSPFTSMASGTRSTPSFKIHATAWGWSPSDTERVASSLSSSRCLPSMAMRVRSHQAIRVNSDPMLHRNAHWADADRVATDVAEPERNAQGDRPASHQVLCPGQRGLA